MNLENKANLSPFWEFLNSETIDKFKLCLVKQKQAWFTTQDVRFQSGDKWDISPAEINAGDPEPYHRQKHFVPYKLISVYWNGPIYPSHFDCSVQQINRLMLPWLFVGEGKTREIYPGVSLPDFVQIVIEAGGEVFFPISFLLSFFKK